jgi:phage terminase large subunit GpA-like protein
MLEVDALADCFEQAALALRPDPELTVSEWADAHRFLSQTASGEPGPWRTERTPYLKEVTDCLSPRSPTAVNVYAAGRRLRRGVKVHTVATGLAKLELFANLRKDPPLL